jgi:ubiquinone/menaquinone biosynthesis C-methylase UbiE
MSKEGQAVTRAVYHDPEIVAGYVEKHAKNPKLFEVVDGFAKKISGNRVLDLGCGPGHDSYRFAELGFDVIGVDYSSEMIKAAQQLKTVANPPHFEVADMIDLPQMFEEDSFDAVWASASLLHIPQSDIPQVLDGIHQVVKDKGMVYIGIKGGSQGEQIVEESKYSKPMKREFIFWEKDKFEALLLEHGFKIEDFNEQRQGENPTTWLNFFLSVQKDS